MAAPSTGGDAVGASGRVNDSSIGINGGSGDPVGDGNDGVGDAEAEITTGAELPSLSDTEPNSTSEPDSVPSVVGMKSSESSSRSSPLPASDVDSEWEFHSRTEAEPVLNVGELAPELPTGTSMWFGSTSMATVAVAAVNVGGWN